MTREGVQSWLDAYVAAWHANDHATILELFTDDASYRYHPYDEPLRGSAAIAADWLEEPDEPGTWEARYETLLLDGDRAVATGETRYSDGQTFSNLFVLEFAADGRCASFTEWFMEQPGK